MRFFLFIIGKCRIFLLHWKFSLQLLFQERLAVPCWVLRYFIAAQREAADVGYTIEPRPRFSPLV